MRSKVNCGIMTQKIEGENLMRPKRFLTLDEQIARLRSLGITMGNEKETRIVLSENSYYNVINGHRNPFLFNGQKEKYKRGTRFTEIYALYHFDRQLRNLLFSFLLEIENKFKTQVIYEFLDSMSHGDDEDGIADGYLKVENFDSSVYSGSKKTEKVINLIANLQKTIAKSFKESETISHHLMTYGHIPLWVLSTRMTFGDIKFFYECMKPGSRQAIAKKYKMQDNHLLTLIQLLAFARNHCAHGNRIYCIRKSVDLPLPDIHEYPKHHQLIIENFGKHNLLNIYIAIKYFISIQRYKELIEKTSILRNSLNKRLTTITINQINAITGLPNDLSTLL